MGEIESRCQVASSGISHAKAWKIGLNANIYLYIAARLINKCRYSDKCLVPLLMHLQGRQVHKNQIGGNDYGVS